MRGHVESCLMGLRFVAMLRTTSRPFFSGRFFDCTGVIAYHIVLCVAVHDAKAECRDAVEALGVGRDEIIYTLKTFELPTPVIHIFLHLSVCMK